MNQRNFLSGLLVAGAGFTILPGNGRIWKAVTDQWTIINPLWVDTDCDRILCSNPKAFEFAYSFVWCKDQARIEHGGFPIYKPQSTIGYPTKLSDWKGPLAADTPLESR